MKSLIIYTLLFLIPLVSFTQDDAIDKQIIDKLTNYSSNNLQEKVYLHTDKSFYVAGEDLWFKAYLMFGPYQVPDSITGVLYVELISKDEKVIDRKILHMREGLGWGEFELPATIEPGKYILKAYTRYMQNYNPAFFYRKWIHVLPDNTSVISGKKKTQNMDLKTTENLELKPVRIRFFPEGGNMVEGLVNYIAFKANDQSGHGVKVKGIIKDSLGTEITAFESRMFGMGLFPLKPDRGKTYIASIVHEGQEYQYNLPKPVKEGYVMHINRKGDNVYIWVRNNMNIHMNNSFVIGQFRGFPFINIHPKQDQDFLYSIINTKDIPSGIIQFTFFDSLGIPQCERLVYTENENYRVDFNIESNKKIYKKREKALFNIHCVDLEEYPILTNMSLSITNTTVVKKDNNKSHIRSYFNLESDLKGYIENPGYYFNPDNEDRYELLDILLLTHGWRRFVWEEILTDKPTELEYSAEVGFNIEGELVDFYNESRSRPGNVRLYIYEDQFYYNEIETDENGLFKFPGINIYDSTHVVMQAWRESKKDDKPIKNKAPETKNDLTINLMKNHYVPVIRALWPEFTRQEKSYKDFFDLNDLILKIDSSYEGRTIILDELTVKDRRIAKEDPFDRPGKFHKKPSTRVVMDSIHANEQSLLLFDILRKYIPGITYNGIPPDIQVSVRGSRSLNSENQALILLDGQPINTDFMYYFPVSEIAFVDVLKSGKATLYGADPGKGAIAIYTRTEPIPYIEEGHMGMLNFVHPGYYRAREFSYPDYDVEDKKDIKPDYRRILYWNPSLTTDDFGDIAFSFYTSDEEAEYRVEIEGMTYNGIPLTYEYYFTVE
ncbi:TonB-dependent receptor plug domain-containing protein [Bacteroidota bacterium]